MAAGIPGDDGIGSHEAMAYQLFLPEAAWLDLPSRLSDPVLARIAADNRRALEAVAVRRGPRRTDVPPHLHEPGPACPWWERPARMLVERRTVAWRLGDATQLAEAIADVADLVERPDWTPHHAGGHALHADLKTAELAYTAAFALDSLPLPPELRDRVAARLADDCLRPYLAGIAAGDWWARATFNWGPSLHGNCLIGALALRATHPELAQAVIAAARAGLAYAVEALRPGGGWVEGLMYQATHLGHLTDALAACARCGLDLGLELDALMRDQLESRIALLMPDGRPANFSGCTQETVEWFLPQAWWWAARLRRPDLTAFEDAHIKPWWDAHGVFHDVSAFWLRPVGAVTAPWQTPRTAHLAAVDWLTWRGAEAWLALRGGGPGNRANRDLGAFLLGWGDQRIAMDPGWGHTATADHTCVLVRGLEQPHASARIVRWRDLPGCFWAVVDLGACHPDTLDHHYRHLLLIDERELLVVDDLRGRAGARCGARWLFQTCLAVEPTADGWRMPAARPVHVRLPAFGGFAVTEHADIERRRPYRTVAWSAAVDAVHEVHPWAIAIDDPPQTACARDGDALVVTRAGRRWRLDLAALHLEPV
jgi:hypothetical protein